MYELLYLIPTVYTDAEVDAIRQKIAQLIEKFDGVVKRNESLAKIKLAYPIKRVRHGTYVYVIFESATSTVSQLDKTLRLTEEVLRHQILLAKPDALLRKFELTAYVAPLSEEGRRQDSSAQPISEAPRRVRSTIEPVIATPLTITPAVEPMSMEELDRKLDEILEDDTTLNV